VIYLLYKPSKYQRRRYIPKINMVNHNKKICLLICSSVPGLQKDKLNDWLSQMPEIKIIAEIEPVFVFGKNSVEITPETWIKLASEINQRLDKFSGFVVIHGADNLLYTSSAISFLLQNLIKPIVFTGSQLVQQSSQDPKKFGIRANLINAIQVATFNLTEVCLMLGNRLLRANQSERIIEESLNIFNAPANSVLGRIDFSIRVFDKVVAQNKGKVRFFNQLDSNIEIINIMPTLDLKSLTKRIADKAGVIVNSGDYHRLPEDLIFLFEKITRDIPVVIWSKSIKTEVLGPKNILIINNMTWEATVVKLMWALTQARNVKKVKELMADNIAQEIIY